MSASRATRAAVHHSIGACGYMASAQVAFDLTLDYVKERKAFGRPVGTFQNSRFKLAQFRAELDALQTFVDQCVLLHNAGKLSSKRLLRPSCSARSWRGA